MGQSGVSVRRRRGLAAAVLSLILAAGCVANATGPARTTGTYSHKAAATAAVASSSVATAAQAARAGADGKAQFPYLSVLIADAEDGLGAATSTFDSIQPPSEEAEAIRAELDDLLSPASEDVSAARVAIRRGDATPLSDLSSSLEERAAALSDFEERHR